MDQQPYRDEPGELVARPESQVTAAQESGKLRDLEFTDIYFNETGEAFMRGLVEGEGPLGQIPPHVMDDLDILHQRVCERGRSGGEFFFDYDGIRFRVTPIGAVDRPWFTLRKYPPLPRFGTLAGIPAKVVEYLGRQGGPGENGRPPKTGLLMFAGAVGNGKTTTAGSLLAEFLTWFGDVAVTLEDPIELQLNGPHGRFGHCFQIPIQDGDFKTAMKNAMRQGPRYIMIGEVRSPAEATQALRAALTGHLVITTIHAGNTREAINALLKFASAEEPIELAQSVLADTLIGVMHQKLLRTRVKNRGRMLKVEYLFPGNDAGIRSLIRSGKTEQLVTAIGQQATRVASGELPVND